MSAPEYFAVPDPTNPAQMTYWRRTPTLFKPWPAKARYAPELFPDDVPKNLYGSDRHEWIRVWHQQHRHPWFAAILAAIDTDPEGCAARFAAFTVRCIQCGRVLKDPTSKTYGIGPDCRDGMPADLLAALSEAVGRAHAERLSAVDSEEAR